MRSSICRIPILTEDKFNFPRSGKHIVVDYTLNVLQHKSHSGQRMTGDGQPGRIKAIKVIAYEQLHVHAYESEID